MGILIRLDLVENKDELNVKVLNDDSGSSYDEISDLVANFNVTFNKKKSNPAVNCISIDHNSTKTNYDNKSESFRTLPRFVVNPLREVSTDVKINDTLLEKNELNFSSNHPPVECEDDTFIDLMEEIECINHDDGDKTDCLEEYFVVENILGTRFNSSTKQHEFLLKLKNCNSVEKSWKPVQHMISTELPQQEGRLYVQKSKDLELSSGIKLNSDKSCEKVSVTKNVFKNDTVVSPDEIDKKCVDILTNYNEYQSMSTSANYDNHFVDVAELENLENYGIKSEKYEDILGVEEKVIFGFDLSGEYHEEENAKADTSKSVQSYICSTCGKTYKLKCHLSTHIRNNHKTNGDNPLTCLICNRTFRNKKCLTLHKRIHSRSNTFSCSHCGHTYAALKELKRHEKNVHGVEYFEKSVKSLHGNRNNESLIEPSNTFEFPINEETNYETDVEPHHSDKPNETTVEITSNDEGNQLTYKSQDIKARKIKVTKKKFKCSTCDQLFKNRNILKIHKTIHNGGQLYACSVCDRLFTYKVALKNHERKHFEVGSFLCSYCSNLFKTRVQLQLHEKMHERKNRQSLIRKKLRFHCSTCGVSFATKSLLMNHRSTHRKVKAISCGQCRKRFSTTEDLSKHLLLHTREMP